MKGNDGRCDHRDQQDKHVCVKKQRLREPLERVERQEAEGFLTQVEICIKVPGEEAGQAVTAETGGRARTPQGRVQVPTGSA